MNYTRRENNPFLIYTTTMPPITTATPASIACCVTLGAIPVDDVVVGEVVEVSGSFSEPAVMVTLTI